MLPSSQGAFTSRFMCNLWWHHGTQKLAAPCLPALSSQISDFLLYRNGALESCLLTLPPTHLQIKRGDILRAMSIAHPFTLLGKSSCDSNARGEKEYSGYCLPFPGA